MASKQSIGTIYAALALTADGVTDEVADAVGDGVEKGTKLDGKSSSNLKKGTMKAVEGGFKDGLNKATGVILGTAGALGAGLYKIGETFDDVYDTLRVGTGLVGDELDAVYEVAKNIGTSIPADFDAIGVAVNDVNTRFGLMGDDLEAVSKQVLELSNLGEDLDINAFSSAVSAFGIEGENVEGAMDKLFQVSQATGVSVNDLSTIIGDNAAQLTNLGFSFEEVASLAGTLDKAGVNASDTFRSMNRGLIKFAKDGEEPAEAFERLTAEITGLVEAGKDAEAIALGAEVFGTRGATSFIQAIQSGKLNLEDFQSALGATDDTITGVAEETWDAAERFKMLKNEMLVTLEPIANDLFSALADSLEDLQPQMEKFGNWFSENIDTVMTVAKWIGIAAAAIVGLNVALTAYNAVVGIVNAITKIWTGIQWLLNTALLSSPIFWIVAAVVAIIAIIWILVDDWDAVWAWILNALDVAWEWIKGVATAIGDFFVGIWDWIAEKAVAAWDGTIGAIQAAWDWIKGIGQSIADFFSGIWASVTDGATALWDNITGFLSNMLETMKNLGKSIGNAFLSIIAGAVNALIWLLNAPSIGWNTLFDAIRDVSFDIPGVGTIGFSWIPTIPLIPNIPVPQLAEGGVISKRRGGILANIGEGDYDEAVVPLKPGIFNELFSDEEGRGAGTTFEQVFNINEVGDGRSTAKKLARQALWTGEAVQNAT